ncbi:alpha/beta-hydrolase N-terminal domain-containing protein, partial [Mycolicibacterium elephantis]
LNAAIGYGIGVFVGSMVRRFVLRGRSWWPPPKRVLWVLQTVVVVGSAVACLLMLIPAAAWQRQISAIMGT